MTGYGNRPEDSPDRGHEKKRSMGQTFTYAPVGLDAWEPKSHHPKPGDPVRITSGPGVGRVKKPFAYVEHAETGEFHGMVNRASLQSQAKSWTEARKKG